MNLKTAAEHYEETRPYFWPLAEAKAQTERLVQSVRDEIADALRKALDCDAGETIETLIPYAASIKDSVNVLRMRIEILEAAQKPAAVAVETPDERNGRLERERFWSGQDHAPWDCMLPSDKARWIDYAKTVKRPKLSPGRRLFEAMNKAYGWGLAWYECLKQTELEAAAKDLGITECDA